MTGRELKKWRKSYARRTGRNFTQKGMAQALGVPFRSYARMERSDAVPLNIMWATKGLDANWLLFSDHAKDCGLSVSYIEKQ